MTQYTYRALTLQDSKPFYALFSAEFIEKYGSIAMGESEVMAELQGPGYDLATDSLAAFDSLGNIAGYIEIRDYINPAVRPYCYGYVRPEHRGNGIATHLLQWAEKRAQKVFERVPEDARVVLQAFSSIESGKVFLEENGYICTRQSLRMEIAFDESPPQPQFPEGYHVVSMADGESLDTMVTMHRETFRDHRGFIEYPHEESKARWEHDIEAYKEVFDPALFTVLKYNNEPAGTILAWRMSQERTDEGWVGVLGIMPAHRRKGLATQYLNYIFHEFIKRGATRAALSVDGSSLTGANQLYEKAGMTVGRAYNAYEKELRAGIELTNQG